MLSFCRFYADDNSIQYAYKNSNNIGCILNYDLKILEKWLLQFSPNKTKVLFYFQNKKTIRQQNFFQRCQLDFVSFYKHLCLLFSDDLKWSMYIETLKSWLYKVRVE